MDIYSAPESAAASPPTPERVLA